MDLGWVDVADTVPSAPAAGPVAPSRRSGTPESPSATPGGDSPWESDSALEFDVAGASAATRARLSALPTRVRIPAGLAASAALRAIERVLEAVELAARDVAVDVHASPLVSRARQAAAAAE